MRNLDSNEVEQAVGGSLSHEVLPQPLPPFSLSAAAIKPPYTFPVEPVKPEDGYIVLPPNPTF